MLNNCPACKNLNIAITLGARTPLRAEGFSKTQHNSFLMIACLLAHEATKHLAGLLSKQTNSQTTLMCHKTRDASVTFLAVGASRPASALWFLYARTPTPAGLPPLNNICLAASTHDNEARALKKAEQLALATSCYHNNCYGNACCWQLFVITTERF